jgi:uracil-DNA glycosylase family 4
MPNLDSDTCRGCPYHSLHRQVPETRTKRAAVPLSAELNGSRTLLVLQAPGVNEWGDGKPLSSREISSAAQRFERALVAANKKRKDFDIAEAVNCYPGKGEDGLDIQPPTPVVETCSRWLADLLKARRYTKIVLFGRVAEQALALAWFSRPTVAQSITRIIRKRYITRESVASIAEALR